MNKLQEALEYIRFNNTYYLIRFIDTQNDLLKYQESFAIIQESINKATPMKVIIKGGVKFCPKCNKSVWQSDESNFCFRCGQALEKTNNV